MKFLGQPVVWQYDSAGQAYFRVEAPDGAPWIVAFGIPQTVNPEEVELGCLQTIRNAIPGHARYACQSFVIYDELWALTSPGATYHMGPSVIGGHIDYRLYQAGPLRQPLEKTVRQFLGRVEQHLKRPPSRETIWFERFDAIADILESGRNRAAMLRAIWGVFDEARAFKHSTTAGSAREAVERVIRNRKMERHAKRKTSKAPATR